MLLHLKAVSIFLCVVLIPTWVDVSRVHPDGQGGRDRGGGNQGHILINVESDVVQGTWKENILCPLYWSEILLPKKM